MHECTHEYVHAYTHIHETSDADEIRLASGSSFRGTLLSAYVCMCKYTGAQACSCAY